MTRFLKVLGDIAAWIVVLALSMVFILATFEFWIFFLVGLIVILLGAVIVWAFDRVLG